MRHQLYSMRRDHVANGRAIIGELDAEEIFDTYDVWLDHVFIPNIASTNKGTLGVEEIGTIIVTFILT
ncbi:hypothetical protein FRX31_030696 [Thalictrum thalictroides]|uniref:Uncharacterized protein n=1 Tax=Thalictrum thalictroides TaxID=46969 RepID=A0A7J6V428_THATH|nr:hypothetical protein FRX31_030696 [Thalictrum thalictroides]